MGCGLPVSFVTGPDVITPLSAREKVAMLFTGVPSEA